MSTSQPQRCPMFQCQACGGQEFNLMLQPGVEATVNIEITDTQDVALTVNGQRFIADLAFMNSFAACRDCGCTKQWSYHYTDH